MGAHRGSRRHEGRDHRRHPLRRRAARRRHAGRPAQGGRDGQAGRGVRLGRVGQGRLRSVRAAHRQGRQGQLAARRFARVRQRGSVRRGLDDPGRASATPRSWTACWTPTRTRRSCANRASSRMAVDSAPDVSRAPHRPRRRRRGGDAARAGRRARWRSWSPRPSRPTSASRATLDLPAPVDEAAVLARAARARGEEPGLEVVHRHGLLRLRHAAGHPAQHPREPGLVHAVHAVPGRDRAGPARGAAQLPDDGGRPHRAARSPTRRCSTRRTAAAEAMAHVLRGRGEPRRATPSSSPSDCHPQTIDGGADARRAARHRGASSATADDVRLRRTTSSACCVQYPATDGAVRDYRALVRARARRRRAGRRRDRPAGAHAAHAARRVRRRHRGRQRAALRRAAGLRRPARRVLRHARRVQARSMPGPHHRRLARTRTASRALPHGAADARAAHPPREGDEQHLHRAGAARGDGRACTPSTTGPRGCARIAERVHALAAVLARGLEQAGRHGSSTSASSTRVRVDGTAARSPRWLTARRERGGSTCAAVDDARVGIALDETTTRDDVDDAARGLRRRARRRFARRASSRRGVDARSPTALARTSAFLTHPVFNTHHSETEMLRYMQRLEATDLSLDARR